MHLIVPSAKGPSQQQMNVSPGNTPPASPRDSSGLPLTPRTERIRTHAMAKSYSFRFQSQIKATHSPFKRNVYRVLSCFSYFIEHDCCSIKGGCCPTVRLTDMRDSVNKMKKCAQCCSGCASVALSCVTLGLYGCYECYALKQDRVKAATIQPL